MAYKALSRQEMMDTMDRLRDMVGKDKHVLLVVFDGAGNLGTGKKLQYQYIATTRREDTPMVIADLAEAIAQRPPAPNVDLN